MKRSIFKLCVFLLLGAIINVAVAWGCAYRATAGQAEAVRYSCYVPDTGDVSTNVYVGCIDNSVSGLAINSNIVLPRNSIAVQEFRGMLPNGSTFLTQAIELRNPLLFHERIAGWPCWSCRGQMSFHSGTPIITGLVRWPSEDEPQWPTYRYPIAPLWPGFAINTVFYAAVVWLLFAAPGTMRRNIRARRGQCPACAYPVGSSDVCTECGTDLRSKA